MALQYSRGFTIIEVIATISIISILATIVVVGYGNWRHHIANVSVQSDMTQATASLKSYNNFKNSYPPNLAGTEFSASQDNALTLYTDAPSIGVYDSLSADQNAQLLLNVCNANLNGLSNTVCTFAGSGGGAKIHVKGTNSTNVNWPTPVNQTDVTLPCGSACDTATNTMITQFLAQGGTFPATISGSGTSLPAPTLTPNGLAANFCLEGRSGSYGDIVYHSSNTNMASIAGGCPSDPSLHYFP
jgi:prepilin-type N-terminal cleavage/methylation domain-containing protein